MPFWTPTEALGWLSRADAAAQLKARGYDDDQAEALLDDAVRLWKAPSDRATVTCPIRATDGGIATTELSEWFTITT